MKFSVSSYSFGAGRFQIGDIGLIALAKEMGFEGIEFANLIVPEGKHIEDHAKEVREACEKAGLTPVSYTIGADFLNGSDGNLDAEVERLHKEIDVAALLGVTKMRHDATGGYKENRAWRGFDDALPTLIEGCRRVTEYAQTKGIRTTVENHGFFCQDSRRVEKLVNGVAHPNFGLLVDIGNFMCADEDPELAVGRVAPYAFHVHAKDFHKKSGNGLPPQDGFFKSRAGNYLRGAIIGHGDVPVLQCLSTLKKNGYDDFVSIEFEGMEEPQKGIACGLNTLKFIEKLL
ncbi:MAG: sugar phosphate isomerase/epimerase [Oscillospiraceae bacterium]|jgi:sugar phosphate isomerase/epimerase|nr:sugar phosphate isomerase/epimerase [Oscillospiraceae bacterium]